MNAKTLVLSWLYREKVKNMNLVDIQRGFTFIPIYFADGVSFVGIPPRNRNGCHFIFLIFLYRNIPCDVYLNQQEDNHSDEGDEIIPRDYHLMR